MKIERFSACLELDYRQRDISKSSFVIVKSREKEITVIREWMKRDFIITFKT